jgi:hypothetical protein
MGVQLKVLKVTLPTPLLKKTKEIFFVAQKKETINKQCGEHPP